MSCCRLRQTQPQFRCSSFPPVCRHLIFKIRRVLIRSPRLIFSVVRLKTFTRYIFAWFATRMQNDQNANFTTNASLRMSVKKKYKKVMVNKLLPVNPSPLIPYYLGKMLCACSELIYLCSFCCVLYHWRSSGTKHLRTLAQFKHSE